VAPSEAWISAWIAVLVLPPLKGGLDLAEAGGPPGPPLAAIASASMALRPSKFSVSAASVGATRTSPLESPAKLVTPYRFRNRPARRRNP